jgi:hypothetical protein
VSRSLALWIIEHRILQEKSPIFTQTLKGIGQLAQVHLVIPEKTTEDEVLEFIKNKNPQLILVPLSYEIAWSRIRAYLNEKHLTLPHYVAYFMEPQFPARTNLPSHQAQRVALDFCNTTSTEVLVILRSFLRKQDRSGIQLLLEPDSLIYCENWYRGQGQGNRLDQVLLLPQLIQFDWIKRSNAIRIILLNFWSLVYESENGRIRANSHSQAQNQFPLAYFQVGADQNCLLLRIFYSAPPLYSAHTVLDEFWPSQINPLLASQMLSKYCDFLRVHFIPEKSEIEVVAGLFQSAPSQNAHEQLHSVWIDPVPQSQSYEQDPPFQVPSPQLPFLRALPTQQHTAKDLAEIEQSTENMLESFQERYSEAQYQIRQYEVELERFKAAGTDKEKLRQLRLRMEALVNREKAWLKKLERTLLDFKDTKQKKMKISPSEAES